MFYFVLSIYIYYRDQYRSGLHNFHSISSILLSSHLIFPQLLPIATSQTILHFRATNKIKFLRSLRIKMKKADWNTQNISNIILKITIPPRSFFHFSLPYSVFFLRFQSTFEQGALSLSSVSWPGNGPDVCRNTQNPIWISSVSLPSFPRNPPRNESKRRKRKKERERERKRL